MSEEERTVTPPAAPPVGDVVAPEPPAPVEPIVELPIVEGTIEMPPAPSFELPPAGRPSELPLELPPPEPPVAHPPIPPLPPAGLADVTSDDRLMSALAWVGLAILQLPLVSAVLLLAEGNKNRPFQRYHAITSILFWVVALIYEGLAVIVFTILTVISLGCLAACLWVIFFVPHLVALYYAFQAYSGKMMDIPLISDFARKQGWL